MQAILVGVQYDKMDFDFEVSINELKELAYACGIDVKGVVVQKLSTISAKYYIGTGKVLELKDMLQQGDCVIFNEELTPSQVKNLSDVLNVEVSDRSDLILRIFESRAKTKEAKLQVEIARSQYLLPRLVGMKKELYSQQGGMGFRGSGEKQIELDRRVIHRKMLQAKRELELIVKQRQTQRVLRKKKGQKVVCLVGYTNSGKSSLLNCFTDKKVFQEDMLFASLQTASRQVYMKNFSFIMSDTVGFIHKLPHHLVQAFRSTLEEVKEADLLIHVVDVSSSYRHEQIQTTLEVLQELGVKDTDMLYVYNKIDLVDEIPCDLNEPNICISIKEGINIDRLQDKIVTMLYKNLELMHCCIPYEKGYLYSYLKNKYEMISESYEENGIHLSCFVDLKDKSYIEKNI